MSADTLDHIDRETTRGLIKRYHHETREARAHWRAGIDGLSAIAASTVLEVIPLLKQPDAAARQIARTKLLECVERITDAVRAGGVQPLVDLFGWSHFGEMNLYDDEPESRANARSFALILGHLLDHPFTREEANDLLIRLYGTDIRHIGPGLTSLLYLLQPGVYPVVGRKATRGFTLLFEQSQRPGKEGLKQLNHHLPLIWDLKDRFSDVLDARDMTDVSGFLHWLGSQNQEVFDRPIIAEDHTRYTPVVLDDISLHLTADKLRSGIDEITGRLAVDPVVIEQAVIHLLMGKSLILTGPPGTGKTELARFIPQVFWNIYPMMATATAEWTSYDVIGGLFPEVVHTETGTDQLRFTIRRGCIYDAIEQNWTPDTDTARMRRRPYRPPDSDAVFDGVWLIIDEFNRADIDRAFGDLFTALETGQLRVPAISNEKYTQSWREIPIPRHFRIIGTLNTFDRHHLFEMSDALKRRFAFVEIHPHPDVSVEQRIVLERVTAELRDRNGDADKKILRALAAPLFDWLMFVRIFRMIGTAQAMAVLVYAGLRISFGQEKMAALGEGLIAHILPQLEGLTRDQLQILAAFSGGNTEAIFDLFEQRMLARIPSAQDRTDLHHFARHLARNSKGATRKTAMDIADLSLLSEDTSHLSLETILMGNDEAPGWRDLFGSALKGPALPAVASTLREMANEGI